MTLDEAIKHAEEVAEQNKWFEENYLEHKGCKECAEEHRQLAEWLKELKAYKEQEPCTDAVSREAVFDILYREQEWYDIKTQIKELPSVTQKSETVTEFADRCRECGKMRFIKDIKADLIDEANEHMTEGDYDDGVRFGLMLAEQIVCMHLGKEQKSGKWINGVCDNCKYDWGKDAPIASVPNFCPNCGARMVEPQESEDQG